MDENDTATFDKLFTPTEPHRFKVRADLILAYGWQKIAEISQTNGVNYQ